jgi:Tfp pilus assembly protein PilN
MNAPNQLSFLPDDYFAKKRARRTNLICSALFVVVMAGVTGAFLVSERMTRSIEKRHAAIELQYAEAAKRLKQVSEMQNKQKQMAQQAELTASLLEKVPRSYLLADITNKMPAGLSLLDFEMVSRIVQQPVKQVSDFEKKKAELDAQNSGKKLTAAPPPPKQYEINMKMTGVAASDVLVAQFLKELSKSKLLKDVNLVISDEFTQDKTKLRKFQIEAVLNPAAQVNANDADKKEKTASVLFN